MNSFVKENTMGTGTAFTENGAASYATIGTALLDQFAKSGTARGRDMETVWVEQSKLWVENPEMALKFPFYLRMITRQTQYNGEKTEKVQKGQGARDESFKRLLWIAKFHPEEFYRNLWLVPVVGSWRDLWVLLTMDDSLDKDAFFGVFAEGIRNESTRDLVKKYLPRIRSDKQCTTEWAKKTNKLAKSFAKAAGWTYQQYRTFKSTGKAHEFQRVICSGLYDHIKWNTIPGKALLNLVSGKFLDNHGLTDSYVNWLKSQPMAKFNGYAYELGMKLGNSYTKPTLAQQVTIDKQFDNLIATASKDDGAIKGNVLCALDTSSSMTTRVNNTTLLSSYDVCVSLGIYFSALNKGEFHNVVAMFDDESSLLTLKGESFTEKWFQIRNESVAWGSTNFQSLIDLICDTRKKNPSIPLEDYPETLLVVSDMQFNPASGWDSCSTPSQDKTNYQKAMEKLRACFPEEFVDNFKIIWWHCAGRPTKDFPSTMDDKKTYMFSGFDGSVISLLLGGEVVIDEKTGKKVEPTMEDIVRAALNQEVLALVQ